MQRHKLFVYGTLKLPEVQLQVLGRRTSQEPDILEGYCKGEVIIHGKTYPIAQIDPNKSIKGVVLDITASELPLLDDYETAAYERLETTLKSGIRAWIYCRP
ncbi:MAG TPA: gamma-glutamylcyclotransferase family protein [Candidatus Saccharimonadales bacterium]|nr:gamma-glutamylcyclotransferase family protein [Candidatus Saccharimonadales bacterium]